MQLEDVCTTVCQIMQNILFEYSFDRYSWVHFEYVLYRYISQLFVHPSFVSSPTNLLFVVGIHFISKGITGMISFYQLGYLLL